MAMADVVHWLDIGGLWLKPVACCKGLKLLSAILNSSREQTHNSSTMMTAMQTLSIIHETASNSLA